MTTLPSTLDNDAIQLSHKSIRSPGVRGVFHASWIGETVSHCPTATSGWFGAAWWPRYTATPLNLFWNWLARNVPGQQQLRFFSPSGSVACGTPDTLLGLLWAACPAWPCAQPQTIFRQNYNPCTVHSPALYAYTHNRESAGWSLALRHKRAWCVRSAATYSLITYMTW